MKSPLLNAKIYARVTGVALAATALLGLVMEMATDGKFIDGFLTFDYTHDVLHLVLAGAALAAGFAAGGAYASLYAKVFGVIYTGLAITGFVSADALKFLGVHLELGEHLVHASIGVWGLVVGFFGTTESSPVRTAAPMGRA